MAKQDREAIEAAYRAGMTCESVYYSVIQSTNYRVAR